MILNYINTSWILLGSLAVVLLCWLWTKNRRPYSKYNIPPFPSTPLPFIGHFFQMFGNLRDKMKAWRKTGGNIYSLDLAGQLHILVNDFNDIKEIWVKHADYIVNTQHNFGDEILNEVNLGIISARDANWKEQRSTSMAILRSFGMGKNLMAEKILEEVSELTEKFASLKGQPEDVRVLLNVSVSNVVSAVAVGKRFEYNDPNLINLIKRLNTFVKYFSSMLILTSFKHLYSLPGDLFHAKKWTQAALEINEKYSKPFIDKYKQDFNANEEPQNFVTAYLKDMKKMKDKGAKSNLNEANLLVIIRTLFSAGTDTTSTTILWCLLYMLHYPRVQVKVYREIEEHVGTVRFPNMADKPKLVYLNAVIMETQRMASLAPIGLRREVSETFEFGDFTFPKGSIIWPILDSVHYDKKLWIDPEIFRPERFIDKNGGLINREELIPFSIGRRVCLGEALARMELFLFLGALFQRFTFEPADLSSELPTLKESFGSTLVPQPFKLRLIERKH